MDALFARELWTAVEPVHVVTYFSAEPIAALKEAGLRGYWMGYFGGRSAPMGAVEAGPVVAAFHGFHPDRVRRAVPDAWSFAAPEKVLRARAAGSAAALRRILPGVDRFAIEAAPLLAAAVAAGDPTGRPLFAANQGLALPDDPVEALWQGATSLREHRGDGHVALLTAEGLDGAQANILAAAVRGTPAAWLKDSRGWSDEEWDAARRALTERGLLDERGAATAEGRALREHIEERTDRIAAQPYAAVADPEELRRLLTPLARAVADSGELPFPNPIGLPRIA
ncbi:SCO6745 family protein [Actinomadura parmotrematis]|uniref:SalK n=1 Tax=Actinomadura parmotrematis TaxID=2864039 RepID=A0ABS7FTB1_9ACTN|nr:hypothetical protein [Actinomadura parmotrematis]MBW8483647.1 hypothetical protein [Actinomadura parmotrematis]